MVKIKNDFLKELFGFSLILLFIYGLIRFVDVSKIMWFFPLENTNDISSYMAQLHFLVQYGYHGFVPNWYNGIILFSIYPPGWFFFVYPLYLIFQNVQIVAYVSLIVQYLLGFSIIYIFGRKFNWSCFKIFSFFILMFFNVFALGDFIRQMRLPALLGLELLMLLCFLIFYYKDRKIDYWWFLIFTPFLAFLIITHQVETILFCVFLLGLFLIKSWKERYLIFLSVILALLLSLFWWLPFLKYSFFESSILSLTLSNWLLNFKTMLLTNLATMLVSVAFLLILLIYLYYKKFIFKDFLFFSPLLVLAFLLLTRLVIFVPILKYVYPEPFIHFFIFLILLLFFSLDFSLLHKSLIKFFFSFLIFLVIFFILVSHFNTPYFITYTKEEKELLSLFPLISQEDRYLPAGLEYHEVVYNRFLGDKTYSSGSYSYNCYGPVYYNLSTPYGWADEYASLEYRQLLSGLSSTYSSRGCESIKSVLKALNTTKVLTYGQDDFDRFGPCMDLVASEGGAYLFKV